MRQFFTVIFAAALSVPLSLTAQDGDSKKVNSAGFTYYQIGQIEHLTPADGQLITKAFEQKFNGRLTLDAVINERLRIIAGVEGGLSTNLNDNSQKISFLLKEAQGVYSFGDPASILVQITGGYFPFKYNPEARHLGEYMYRSGTYPQFIISDFDFPMVRLMGWKASCTVLENYRLHVLFTSEYAVQPYFDYSLGLFGDLSLLNKCISMGGGIDFDRCIPIDPKKTTDPGNIVKDSMNNPVVVNGDTLRFTLRGTKLVGRLTLDPKQLCPLPDFLGPEDGKIYSEIAVLGLKNYGDAYRDIANRIPLMFGFNLPVFKPLDFLINSIFGVNFFQSTDIVSYEVEYFNFDPRFKLDVPSSGKADPSPYMGDPAERTKWKKSLYIRLTLTKGLDLKCLFARDHFRDVTAGGNYDPVERLNGPDDWHYKLRVQYSF